MCPIKPVQGLIDSPQAEERLPLEKAELVFVDAEVLAFELPSFKIHVQECQCSFRAAQLFLSIGARHVCKNSGEFRLGHGVEFIHCPIRDIIEFQLRRTGNYIKEKPHSYIGIFGALQHSLCQSKGGRQLALASKFFSCVDFFFCRLNMRHILFLDSVEMSSNRKM